MILKLTTFLFLLLASPILCNAQLYIVNDSTKIKVTKDSVLIEKDHPQTWTVKGTEETPGGAYVFLGEKKALHIHPRKYGVTKIELISFAGLGFDSAGRLAAISGRRVLESYLSNKQT